MCNPFNNANVDTPDSTAQTASRSVQPFMQGSQHDRQIDRQTIPPGQTFTNLGSDVQQDPSVNLPNFVPLCKPGYETSSATFRRFC